MNIKEQRRIKAQIKSHEFIKSNFNQPSTIKVSLETHKIRKTK